MTMVCPAWWNYVEWDYSDHSFPVMKGLRKDTPEDIVRQFEEDQEMYRTAREEGIYL